MTVATDPRTRQDGLGWVTRAIFGDPRLWLGMPPDPVPASHRPAAIVHPGRRVNWYGDDTQRSRGIALLNALLGVATVIPAVTKAWPLLMASGLLFGGVFLSVVASTTALVRHNLPASQWAVGISAFTTVFALGQIVGPSIVGWIADGPGGLTRGLAFSAGALWVGALVALRQRALPQA